MAEQFPDIIHQVSHGFFFVARYSGGCNINGSFYVYNPENDTLVKQWPKQRHAFDRNDPLRRCKKCGAMFPYKGVKKTKCQGVISAANDSEGGKSNDTK